MQIKINETLRLELLDETHAEPIFNLVKDARPYLKQWLPWVDRTLTIDNTKDFIKSAKKQHTDKKGFVCAILFNKDVAGVIGLHQIDYFNKTVSIGYWLGEHFQGLGIMTGACNALTDYCFNTLELNRVEIKCGTGNLKSQAIPERLYFKKEGIIRQGEFLNGQFIDLYLYSKLREESRIVM